MTAVPPALDACLLARFDGQRVPDWLRRWLDEGLGGVVLFAQNIAGPDQLRLLVGELRARRPDLIVAVDEEGGLVSRLEARTGSSFPGNSALGAVDDPALTRQVAAAIGGRLAAADLSLNLAPVADLANPLNSVIGLRSFGPEPARAAAHTTAFVEGVQGCGVAACAKHFPGHGRGAGDSHLVLPVVDAPLATMRESDLVPFAAAIAAGVRCVMTAHVLFPAVDSVPATLSRRWLTGVLRGELGFAGTIVSDALDMAAIGDNAVQAAGAVRAMAAGADLLCLSADHAAQLRARDTLAAAVRDGTLAPGRIEAAAARVGELAAWTRAQAARRKDSGTAGAMRGADDSALGLAAARRALQVCLTATPASGGPFVLDAGWLRGLGAGAAPAAGVGEAAASLLTIVSGLIPGTDGRRLSEEAGGGAPDVAGLLGQARGRPLIVAVRDARERPWQRDLLAAALAARPDAIVVATGGDDRALAGASYIGTRGPALANLTAAAELLARLLSGPPAGEDAAR
ncbi:MAG TPA: beta-N-acetylhexosaminidase [Streptosporangiaceae bacterium]|nr:beta-N-acetylhexosaminidase [Streptosporangiaceae bacterium]